MLNRQKKMVGAAAGIALVATLALGPSMASADPIDVTGDASGLTVAVETPAGPVAVGPTPSVATPPGGSESVASAAVPGVVSTDVLTASSQGSSTGVTSVAQVVGANVLAGTVTADVISSTCTSTAAGSTGASSLADAQAAGVPVNASPPPNTTFDLPGIGTLFLNEQVRSDSPGHTSITVNAVRLALTGGVVTGGILISHSACAASGPEVAGGGAGAGAGAGVGGAGAAGPADAVTSEPRFTG